MVKRQYETELRSAFEEAGMGPTHRKKVLDALQELRPHDQATYEHSIRVGLKARDIALFMNIDPKPALYGVLHDIGKVRIPQEIVGKTKGFDEKDMETMRKHTLEGFNILLKRGYMFTAWLALTHHRYQETPYPFNLPGLPFPLSEQTQFSLRQYSRIIALADFNDALHRRNDRFGDIEMKASHAKKIMLDQNRDQEFLLRRLYKEGVLT